MPFQKVGWGVLAAGIVWAISRSVFLALLIFAFCAGAALFKAYWRSLDDKIEG